MRSLIYILVLVLLPVMSYSQDSTSVLSYEDFMEQVIDHHPYAFQANNIQQMGVSGLRASRGAFDPVLFGDVNQKYFNDKQYYSEIQGGLKIPTWFGISMETGYTLNEGAFLDPSRNTPNAGLWYAGVRVELGNGMIIDQRRAAFEKAKLFMQSSEIERTIMLNELQRNAAIAYWDWLKATQQLEVYELAYNNANERFNATKEAVIFGDRPSIDTVEANMVLQQREQSFIAAKTKQENAKTALEMFLWIDGIVPLELDNVRPQSPLNVAQNEMVLDRDSLLVNHPILQLNDLSIKEQRVELQLKREQLKPKLTIKYNALSEPINNNPMAQYSPSNYTWGASLAYPILSRKERGNLQLAKLKMENQVMKNSMKSAELEYKVNSTFNNYLLAQDQLNISNKYVFNAQTMYFAEQELFVMGESSVFMINSRESSWLKAQIELIDRAVEAEQLLAELRYQLMVY